MSQIFCILCTGIIQAMVLYHPGNSLHFSSLEPLNISSWPVAIIKTELEDLPQILKISNEKDRRLFATTDFDGLLYKVPVTLHESISGLLVMLKCAPISADSQEQLKRNISTAVELLRAGILPDAYENKSMSFSFAICPVFNSLKDFEHILRAIADLNIKHQYMVKTILLNFGALRLGQINAFHVIQYVEIARDYGRSGQFRTGLLFDSRICSSSLFDMLRIQLREIANTPIFIEETVLDRREGDEYVREYIRDCADRLGWLPVYFLPDLRLIISERLYLLDRLYSSEDGLIIPLYNVVNETFLSNNKVCPVDTRFPPKYPVDYIVSLDADDFFTAFEHENVTLQFSGYNASFFDVYRRFLIHFGTYELARSTVPQVLSTVLNYSRANPNEYFQRPLSLWIVFTPSGDLRTQLLDLLKSVVATKSELKGLVSHVFLDYGSLLVTSLEYSNLNRDAELCSEILESKNLSCGFIVNKRNCVIKGTSLEKLPFSRNNILISKGLSAFCVLGLKVKTQFAFVNGMITVNFMLQTSKVTRETAKVEFDPRTSCPYIGSDSSIRSISTIVSTDKTIHSEGPFEEKWLQTKFNFSRSIGFTMNSSTAKLYSHLSQIIVLTNTNITEMNQGTKLLATAEHNLDLNSLVSCKKRFSVTFAIDWNLTEQFSRLDELFEMLQNAQLVTPSVCYSVLMDWAPFNLDNDNNSVIPVQKLSIRLRTFMIILNYAQRKSSTFGINIDIYLDVWFMKTQIFAIRNPENKIVWNKAFRNIGFFVFRVETSFQTLLAQHASKTAYSIIAEMEDTFMAIQFMMFHLDPTRQQPNQVDRIIFHLTVFGCSGQMSLPQAIEFAKFIEIIDNWAVLANGMVIIANSAINENKNNCSQPSHPVLHPKYCPCGWWIEDVPKNLLKTMKAYAKDLYYLQHPHEAKESPIFSNVGILLTCLGFLLLLASSVTVGVYCSKHLRRYCEAF